LADAERTFKEALSLESADGPSISFDLASLYVMSNRNKEAEPYLVTLLNRSPKDVTLRMTLGDVYGRERRFDEALKIYEPLTKEPAAFVSATARMAYCEYEAGRKEQAHKRLREALASAPKESELHAMSARLRLADRNFREAEVAARAAVQIAPDRFDAVYALGAALAEDGREQEALPILKHAAELSPRAIGAKLQLGRIYLNAGDARTALQFAEEAVTIDQKQPLARLLLVRVLVAQRNAQRAEDALQPLIRDYPDSPQTQGAAGAVALLRGDREAARRAFVRTLELNPRSVEGLIGLVMVNLASQKPDAALSLIKEALANDSDDARVLMLAARTYITTKDDKQAEEILDRVIKTSPSATTDAYGMLAGLYLKQNRLEQAKTQLEAMVRQQPTAVGPQTMLGIVLQLQGKPKEAQAVYASLLQAKPDAAVAANNLAMLLVESGGNLDLALNYAQAAKKGLPNDPDISDTLGLVYWKKGLSSLAVSAFEVSTKAQPNNAEFWLHLGQAYVGSGKKIEAREALQRALKLDSQSAGAATARKLLADLNKRA
jgi:tetratricopeptide (TPR) repeat protein